MPVTQSATKALRQDRKRTLVNRPVKSRTQTAVILARKDPTQETVRTAFSALDKAAKKHLIKKGKANRLKSRLAALLTKGKSPQPAASAKAKAPTRKKTAPQKTAKKSPAKKTAAQTAAGKKKA